MTNSANSAERGGVDVASLFQVDPDALAEMIAQLRMIAHAARRRLPVGQTLATTALVNEAFLKLSRPASALAMDQRHFYALAARAVREILIDEAKRRALRPHQLPSEAKDALDDDATPMWLAPELDPLQIVALDQAMQGLADVHPRLADVVTCRFFAGYTEAETAEVLDVDVRTVQRDWLRARAWLGELASP